MNFSSSPQWSRPPHPSAPFSFFPVFLLLQACTSAIFPAAARRLTCLCFLPLPSLSHRHGSSLTLAPASSSMSALIHPEASGGLLPSFLRRRCRRLSAAALVWMWEALGANHKAPRRLLERPAEVLLPTCRGRQPSFRVSADRIATWRAQTPPPGAALVAGHMFPFQTCLADLVSPPGGNIDPAAAG